jgi:hypothetical protein
MGVTTTANKVPNAGLQHQAETSMALGNRHHWPEAGEADPQRA